MKFKIKDVVVSMLASEGKGPVKHLMYYLGKGCDGPCTCYETGCGSTCGNTCDWNLSQITRGHGSVAEELSFYNQLEKQLTSALSRTKNRKAALTKQRSSRRTRSKKS
jgi:hypothetical protein